MRTHVGTHAVRASQLLVSCATPHGSPAPASLTLPAPVAPAEICGCVADPPPAALTGAAAVLVDLLDECLCRSPV